MTDKKTKKPEKDSEKYAKLQTKLENIVKDIGSEEIELDQLIAKVEEGYQLIDKMRKRLQATKDNLDEIMQRHEPQ